MEEIKVGLIGFGYIGKIHAIAYRDLSLCIDRPKVQVKLAALLRSRLDSDQEAMQAAGFSIATTSVQEFYNQTLDLVDVCTPNYLHLEQCQQALQRGLAVYCEKPLAMNFEEAQSLARLAEKSGCLTQVAYVRRYDPAVRQMKALIEAGEIGEIFNFRGHLFHGSYVDPNRSMSWRLRQAQSGGGAFMDLGAHLVDLTRYVLGEVAGLQAEMRTFISERYQGKGSHVKEKVDVDDWALCRLELCRGASGVLEVTRLASGASQDSGFEVYGSKGSLFYRESKPKSVHFYDNKLGKWLQPPANVPLLPGERSIEQIWPSGKYSQGYMIDHHLASQYDFLLNLVENKPSQIDFRAAALTQRVIDAAYTSAAHGGELASLN
jgi:predicted dehydrogenase